MKTNLFDPNALLSNHVVLEEYTIEEKTKEFFFPTGNCDVFFETLQGIIRNHEESEIINSLDVFEELPICKTVLTKSNILGEYFPEERKIKYYKQSLENMEIVKIHERFHALHHLTQEQNGDIWENFSVVSPFYKELLAQLFTYIFICDNETLLRCFKELNRNQPLIYQTFKIFKHYTKHQAEDLYWAIRKNTLSDQIRSVLIKTEILLLSKKSLTGCKSINDAVFNGIRKTINRFREQPFLYFTESDIHASLSKDIMEGNSDLFIIGKDLNMRSNVKVPVSLVHHEYPTNFRYENSKLKIEGYTDGDLGLTDIDGDHGDRGNYDLVILNEVFINELFLQHEGNPLEALKHIINKNKKLTETRNTKKEILFAIEVKFIHPFNAGNNQMETEVRKDNNKLHLALRKSDNYIMPINLIFCSSDYVKSNSISVINNVKDILVKETPCGVCSIFIESYLSGKIKKTNKPIFSFNPLAPDRNWASDLKSIL